MANNFDHERWMNLTIEGLMNDIRKCYASKKQSELPLTVLEICYNLQQG